MGLLGRRGWGHPSLTVVSFPMPLRSPRQGYPAHLPGGGGWAGSTRSGSACPSGCRGVSSGQGWPAPLSVGSPGDDPGPLSARPRAPVGLPALSSASHSRSPLSRKPGSFAPHPDSVYQMATCHRGGLWLPSSPNPREGRKTGSLSCFKAQSALSGSPRKLRHPAQDRRARVCSRDEEQISSTSRANE